MIRVYVIEINPPLYGQISDETRYTLMLPSYDHLPRRSQSKKKLTPTTITQTSICFPPWSFPYLSLVFRPFPFLYTFLHSPLPNIGVMSRVFANGLEDLGSIPGRVIPKTQKMLLDAFLLNPQHYKVRIKDKVG